MSASPDLDRFHERVAHLRPALHRYCARMTGTVFDGEDVVQDTLAKAFYALASMEEAPPLEPWLFRIAHNTAMDWLRRYERKNVVVLAEVPEPEPPQPDVDGDLMHRALSVFAALPPAQRSAIVLKDLLGLDIEETAAAMETTVPAVKSLLSRARGRLPREGPPPPRTADIDERLRRYARLFDARDWDGLAALVTDESRLDLVGRTSRRGAGVAAYWARYTDLAPRERLRAVPGWADGVPVIAIHRGESPEPAYFVLVTFEGEHIAMIRDYHYVPTITDGARFYGAA